MLKCLCKQSQYGDLVPHLGKESEIPFLDTRTCVLLGVGQDRFRLIQEAVGVLQRWPQWCRRLQSFREKML